VTPQVALRPSTNYVPKMVAVHNEVGRLWDAGEPFWDADNC
jgi:hypothetical protein